jgi:hypothetical protein
MSDHTAIMHRLDRQHAQCHKLLRGVHGSDSDEQTIQEYFASSAGRVWKDEEFLTIVQHYIKWTAVQEFANEANRQLIKKQVCYCC